jgi:hypothetical protein
MDDKHKSNGKVLHFVQDDSKKRVNRSTLASEDERDVVGLLLGADPGAQRLN